MVIPTLYRATMENPKDVCWNVPDDLLCKQNIDMKHLRIYGALKILPTAENPIAGLEPLSKGKTVIVGHNQLQMKSMPVISGNSLAIIHTTGTITVPNYIVSKQGEKANFNHSYSALVVEIDEEHDLFHLRVLNADPSNGFYDLDTYYSAYGITKDCTVAAIVTGDEHAIFRDESVEKWTYTDPKSLVATLKPEYIVRHDIFDAYSVSHHHTKNTFTQYAKWQSGHGSVEDELKLTVDYINNTTPEFATSLIVPSNHNDHLLRWLNEVDIKKEPWNAKLYHFLMYQMLDKTVMGPGGTQHPDPLELITRNWLKGNVQFIRSGGYKIHGIEVGQHGSYGINGAKSSAISYADLPEKMIVGHSHTPQILRGCYVVGTSSKMKLEYVKGGSSWRHCHCIIHNNGKRQLIFLTKHGYRLN
jgi:hypothetical protein